MDDLSRFRRTEQIIVDGKETFGRWVPPSFLVDRPPASQIKVFRVTSALEGRPDLIAAAVYGSPLLDWVLIAFNNAREALNWPRAGAVIEYPLDSVVLPAIL